jgi:hypothetical protein
MAEKPDLSATSAADLVALMTACGLSPDPSDQEFARACRDELARRKPPVGARQEHLLTHPGSKATMTRGDDRTIPDDVWSDDDPTLDVVETALLLAWDDRLGDCPDAAAIAGWTPEQRREAFRWAVTDTGREPFRWAVNDVAGVPVPEFLKLGVKP